MANIQTEIDIEDYIDEISDNTLLNEVFYERALYDKAEDIIKKHNKKCIDSVLEKDTECWKIRNALCQLCDISCDCETADLLEAIKLKIE